MNRAFTDKISYMEYLRYLMPTVISMIFLSFYTTIDGFFVSRYAGPDALAAINIIIPLTCLFFGIAIMLATGSGAIIGMRQGRGENERAESFFTFVTLFLIVVAIALTVFCLVFLDDILKISGSTPKLDPYTYPYGLLTTLMIPGMIFKLYFEYFTRIDGHPKLGLVMSFTGLALNVFFDWLFIVPMDMGITGAGLGTALAMYISAAIGLWHFLSGRSNLRFRKPSVEWKALAQSVYNGCSEMMSELSTGITTLLFNWTLLRYAGETGVAAMSVITYFYYFFSSLYFGVTTAGQPVISYNIGAGNTEKQKEIVRQSFVTLLSGAVFITLGCMIFAEPLVSIFTEDPDVMSVAVHGFIFFSTAFLLNGINIFISGYFTAAGNGALSAIVSISRTLVFVVIFLQLLPRTPLGADGIWLTNFAAEIATLVIALPLYMKYNLHSRRTEISRF